ncbi:aspartate aminotransferase [Nitzschia inconspicua]|uniref:aspartate transaminase n=1 Tax=Nitzschia inconspicua TaxID=303405 RepID=A0A9K3LXY1_9STRA|nr:aspartate aminotransferase [Nitzschia inconspicua]
MATTTENLSSSIENNSDEDDEGGRAAFAAQKKHKMSPHSAGTVDRPSSIRRSSLLLSPEWDMERKSLRHLGDLDDDDQIRIAYFPNIPTIQDVATNEGDDDAPAVDVSAARRSLFKTKTHATVTSDDEWSTASVTSDSLSDFDDDDDHTVTGIWQNVPEAPPDAILGIAAAYKACEHPQKVNICVGAYRDDNGNPYVLPTVRKAEYRLLEQNEVKEYLPIEGDRDFVYCAMKFAYGREMDIENHVAAVQSLSGTGACMLGGQFLAQFWGSDHPIYVPNPTWGNHIKIFKQCGLKVRKYRYYDRSKNALDFEGMLKDIKRAKDGSIILLHACAHNPTGCDPTMEQWKEIVSLISSKSHIAFFDSAYQGFATGNSEKDAQAFRYAVSQHVPILLAQSFAKNFGLYGERVGTLSIVCGDVVQKERIMSELRSIIRPLYSSPPRHGSSIVKTILMDPALKEEYYQECAKMAIRIKKMRKKLEEALQVAGSIHDWSHITKQIGMFAYTGMDEAMCKQLTEEFSIFLTTNGRISMVGLNNSNLTYVANAIHTVTAGKTITA